MFFYLWKYLVFHPYVLGNWISKKERIFTIHDSLMIGYRIYTWLWKVASGSGPSVPGTQLRGCHWASTSVFDFTCDCTNHFSTVDLSFPIFVEREHFFHLTTVQGCIEEKLTRVNGLQRSIGNFPSDLCNKMKV